MVETISSALLHPLSDAGDHDSSNLLQTGAERPVGFARLLRIVAWCWLGYVAILYLLNDVLVAGAPQLQLSAFVVRRSSLAGRNTSRHRR